MPRAAASLILVVICGGLAAEWVRYGPDTPVLGGVDTLPRWVADLATGWSIALAGFVAWTRFPVSRVGQLLVVMGVAWFAGDLTGSRTPEVAWLATQLWLLYLGVLAHVLVSYPTGRATANLQRGVVMVAYFAAIGFGAALSSPLWGDARASIPIATLVVGTVLHGYTTTTGALRRARLLALQVAGSLWSVLLLAAVLSQRRAVMGEQTSLVTQVVLVAAAFVLSLGLSRAYRHPSRLTDIVVELAQGGSASLRHSLARILGDSDLDIGYWIADRGGYLTAEGVRLDPDATPSTRALTRVERDGQPVACIVHDRRLLRDPGLLDAVSAAARLGASNDRLRAAIGARLAELEVSRRRLVAARDEERIRLEQRLRGGAQRAVESLVPTLGTAMAAAVAATSGATILAIERAQVQVSRLLDDFRDLAWGLHPGSLGEVGLARALDVLAEDCVVPVRSSVVVGAVDAQAAAATWFICSEALANVAKHAHAAHASVSVQAVGDTLVIEIEDDGSGGADMIQGSGLRGLADRAEALGGTFHVDSRVGVGTRIEATIPTIRPSPDVMHDRGTVASINTLLTNTPAGTDDGPLAPSYRGVTNHHTEADHG